jgi:hypothetical protein
MIPKLAGEILLYILLAWLTGMVLNWLLGSGYRISDWIFSGPLVLAAGELAFIWIVFSLAQRPTDNDESE